MCHHLQGSLPSLTVTQWYFYNIYVLFVFLQLPDLMHSESLQTDPVVTFVCQNFGLLLGICIMLIIALYEEDLMAVNW